MSIRIDRSNSMVALPKITTIQPPQNREQNVQSAAVLRSSEENDLLKQPENQVLIRKLQKFYQNTLRDAELRHEVKRRTDLEMIEAGLFRLCGDHFFVCRVVLTAPQNQTSEESWPDPRSQCFKKKQQFFQSVHMVVQVDSTMVHFHPETSLVETENRKSNFPPVLLAMGFDKDDSYQLPNTPEIRRALCEVIRNLNMHENPNMDTVDFVQEMIKSQRQLNKQLKGYLKRYLAYAQTTLNPDRRLIQEDGNVFDYGAGVLAWTSKEEVDAFLNGSIAFNTETWANEKAMMIAFSQAWQTPAIPPMTAPIEMSTVAGLMNQFTACWKSAENSFDFTKHPFNIKNFVCRIACHLEKFQKKGIDNTHFGFIEKFDLDPADNPQLYVRADLHGDLKSLIANLTTLQQQGLLDENYKCKPGFHLVLLGDYCDRGFDGTQILEMLICLKEENPNQVHLIRGNHEYAETNLLYGLTDQRLMQLAKPPFGFLLDRFYATMSLTTYFSLMGPVERQYVQFTHGLFEPAMDPAPLLDQRKSGDYLAVPRRRQLSERISKIDAEHPLATYAYWLKRLVTFSRYEPDLTAYNWADITEGASTPGGLGNRTYKLSAHDIQCYLSLSSEQHRVMMIFRGHQHALQHLKHGGRVLVTTLPVGANTGYYEKGSDCAYIITLQEKVENWQKRSITREKNQDVCVVSEESRGLTEDTF